MRIADDGRLGDIVMRHEGAFDLRRAEPMAGYVQDVVDPAGDPLALAGVTQHSSYRTDPLGRLHRTGAFLGTTTFGTVAEADQAIATVRSIHARVQGTAADGRPYSALDPHLLAWVHCTEADSFLRARQRYGSSPIADDLADRYVAEIGEQAIRDVYRRASELRKCAPGRDAWLRPEKSLPQCRVSGNLLSRTILDERKSRCTVAERARERGRAAAWADDADRECR